MKQSKSKKPKTSRTQEPLKTSPVCSISCGAEGISVVTGCELNNPANAKDAQEKHLSACLNCGAEGNSIVFGSAAPDHRA